MSSVRDRARFAIMADPALVSAAFSCQFCLWVADLVVVDREHPTATARCFCAGCDTWTEIVLDEGQILRLEHAPPRGLPIRWSY
jgi:hypothetical protein